jgi:hypothetical protein
MAQAYIMRRFAHPASRSGAREPLREKPFALVGALAALPLRPAEEFGELPGSMALGVLGVDLEPQDIAQALLEEP